MSANAERALADARYRVGARFRYRIDRDQHLLLGYVLERPHLVLESAFGDVVDSLREGVGQTDSGDHVPPVQAPIYQGRP